MTSLEAFDRALTGPERRLMARLDTPDGIQAFLDGLTYSADDHYRCPLRVVRERTAHCFDGAVFAAAALRRLGRPGLILEMLPNDRDDDHLLALFKLDGHWGAIGKSNYVGLRYREPVYRTLRELVMSYFEFYHNTAREKTLRGYKRLLDLKAFDRFDWMTQDAPLDRIGERLDTLPRVPLITRRMAMRLTLLDERSLRAGLQGANEAGLFRPPVGKKRRY